MQTYGILAPHKTSFPSTYQPFAVDNKPRANCGRIKFNKVFIRKREVLSL
jgi:hypothetical protein